MGQTAAIVIHLMNLYLDKGYHVFTDNWYNSVPLTKYMSQKNLHYWHPTSRQKTSAGSSLEEEIEKGRDGFSVIRRHHYHKMEGQKRCAFDHQCLCS